MSKSQKNNSIVDLTESFTNLYDDVNSLWCSRSNSQTISNLPNTPSSFEFLRDYVTPSIPCIIQNSILVNKEEEGGGEGEEQKLQPLILSLDDIITIRSSVNNEKELNDCSMNNMISVNVTPDGFGDCVRNVVVSNSDNISNNNEQHTKKMFVMPLEREMDLMQFRNKLRCSSSSIRREEKMNACMEKEFPLVESSNNHFDDDDDDDDNDGSILYYSKQNDCLRTEFAFLLNQNILPKTFLFAEEAFNTGPPDAINIWIGNEQSVSSMHKDHYENLYYVSSGEKIFTLCPPSNVVFLQERDFESGCFQYNNYHQSDVSSSNNNNNEKGYWSVMPYSKKHNVKWIECDDVNHVDQNNRHYPDLKYTNPMTIHVKAGEMIYIPALWYHRVTQSCETVAINYWFDMKFDMKWCYYNFLQNISIERNNI